MRQVRAAVDAPVVTDELLARHLLLYLRAFAGSELGTAFTEMKYPGGTTGNVAGAGLLENFWPSLN